VTTVLPQLTANRYVTPLKEGGSLPGIVEADDDGTYVMKFRGAGQGLKVLVAEVIVAGLARLIDVPVPDLAVITLDPRIAKYEADEEVQDLLNASPGPNLGVDFLPGAFGYDGELDRQTRSSATRILWLDAFTANVDRSWRNPNLLRWHDEVWVIDHGASLYFHHGWSNGITAPERFATQPWDVSDHVLRTHAGALARLDAELGDRLDQEVFVEVLAEVPDAWLEPVPGAETADLLRAAHVDFLEARLATRQWLPLERAS
jgi:HipA-like kinase